MNYLFLINFLCLILLCGCGQEKVEDPKPLFFAESFVDENLEVGMNRSEVVDIFGEPGFVYVDEGIEKMQFVEYPPQKGKFRFSGFTVYLKDDVVIKISKMHSDFE